MSETCKYKRQVNADSVACQLTAFGSGYCILHDPDPTKDVSLFEQTLHQYLENCRQQSKNVFLSGCVFPKISGFANRHFPVLVSFDEAVFLVDANFAAVDFFGGCSFVGAQFRGKSEFTNMKCGQPGSFDKAEFFGEACFDGAAWSSTFSMREATFRKAVTLERMVVERIALFDGGRFESSVSFAGTSFKDRLNMPKAHFECEVLFARCSFARHAIFAGSVFSKTADFCEISTQESLSFADVAFHGLVRFDKARLGQRLSFHRTKFLNSAELKGVQTEGVTIQGCDLRGFRFLDVLPNTEFYDIEDVRWPRKRVFRWWKGRHFVPDEPEAPKSSKLRNFYRELHKTYYDQNEFQLARDFYIGFMVMKRRTMKGERVTQVLDWLYEKTSLYGESIRRPFLCLIALWLICPLILLALGVRLEPGQSEVVQRVRLWPLGNPIFFTQVYWKAFVLNLSLSTIVRTSELQPVITSAQNALLILETALNALFAAFLAIGVRRHFAPKKPLPKSENAE